MCEFDEGIKNKYLKDNVERVCFVNLGMVYYQAVSFHIIKRFSMWEYVVVNANYLNFKFFTLTSDVNVKLCGCLCENVMFLNLIINHMHRYTIWLTISSLCIDVSGLQSGMFHIGITFTKWEAKFNRIQIKIVFAFCSLKPKSLYISLVSCLPSTR